MDHSFCIPRVGNKQIKQIKSARFSLVTTFVSLVLPCFGEFDLFVANSVYSMLGLVLKHDCADAQIQEFTNAVLRKVW